ncbi:MAG: hypothetical protein WC980_06030 [Candidatus Brocadiia bacterium]
MAEKIPVSKTQSIRASGFDEYWLQDQIVENPSCLDLGDLEVISKERRQTSGGRLDILLKNPEDDSMYEVEVMLGETDETHIIRTLEYWDNEKRKWPQRQHFAVLVAESITRRFFNVIQLLSHSIPVIAIQANMIISGEQKILHFTKVLDTYEEPEDIEVSQEAHDEDYWQTKASWTLETAKTFLETLKPIYQDASLRYVKNYIAITVNNNNYFWFHKRAENKSILGLWTGKNLIEKAASILDKSNISHSKKIDHLKIHVDKKIIEANISIFKELANIVKQSWGS